MHFLVKTHWVDCFGWLACCSSRSPTFFPPPTPYTDRNSRWTLLSIDVPLPQSHPQRSHSSPPYPYHPRPHTYLCLRPARLYFLLIIPTPPIIESSNSNHSLGYRYLCLWASYTPVFGRYFLYHHSPHHSPPRILLSAPRARSSTIPYVNSRD